MLATLLDIFRIDRHGSEMEATLYDIVAAMEKLHRVPQRPAIPIVIDTRIRDEGHYIFLVTAPNRPVRILISSRASHPRMTLAHEIGHFLDNQVMHALKQGFASSYDDDFDLLRGAWEQTRTVKNLRQLLRRHAARMQAGDRRYLRELVTPKELWASTYAQWAATKLGDPAMQQELDKEIMPTGMLAGTPFTSQWDHSDFQGIMLLVDELFESEGFYDNGNSTEDAKKTKSKAPARRKTVKKLTLNRGFSRGMDIICNGKPYVGS